MKRHFLAMMLGAIPIWFVAMLWPSRPSKVVPTTISVTTPRPAPSAPAVLDHYHALCEATPGAQGELNALDTLNELTAETCPEAARQALQEGGPWPLTKKRA